MTFTCKQCGKYVDREAYDPDAYCYKKRIRIGTHNKLAYFCGWNCMRKWEKERKANWGHVNG